MWNIKNIMNEPNAPLGLIWKSKPPFLTEVFYSAFFSVPIFGQRSSKQFFFANLLNSVLLFNSVNWLKNPHSFLVNVWVGKSDYLLSFLFKSLTLIIIAKINKTLETIPEKGPFFRLLKSNSEIFMIKRIIPAIITI